MSRQPSSAVVKVKRKVARRIKGLLIRAARAQPQGPPSPEDDRRVTILLFSAWGMGGTIRAALNMAGYLAEQGRDVEILSIHRSRDESFFGAFPPGVKVTALNDVRESARPRGLAGLAYKALVSRQSVLVHQADRWASYFSLWTDIKLVRALRRRRGILVATRPGINLMVAEMSPPGMVTIGLEQMHLLHHHPQLRQMMKRHYRKLDAFVVLTEGHREQYREHLGRHTPHLEVIPNTVRDLGPPPADLSSKTIFTAGRFFMQKGFDLLLDAYAPVAAKHPDWRLRICGHGRQGPNLEAQIERLGLQDVVSLEGPTATIGDDMAKASIFALSSRFEGFPLILIEAMSKSMAVVAFDCPTGPGEIVRTGENGILVPAEDVQGFTDGLLRMIEDEDLRRRCGPAAAETAHGYTMEVIGPRWEALFAELIARKAGGAGAAYADADGRSAGAAVASGSR